MGTLDLRLTLLSSTAIAQSIDRNLPPAARLAAQDALVKGNLSVNPELPTSAASRSIATTSRCG